MAAALHFNGGGRVFGTGCQPDHKSKSERITQSCRLTRVFNRLNAIRAANDTVDTSFYRLRNRPYHETRSVKTVKQRQDVPLKRVLKRQSLISRAKSR